MWKEDEIRREKKKDSNVTDAGIKMQLQRKFFVPQKRNVKTGLYIPTPKAHRHLTKPIHRYGMEKCYYSFYPESKLFTRWFHSRN